VAGTGPSLQIGPIILSLWTIASDFFIKWLKVAGGAASKSVYYWNPFFGVFFLKKSLFCFRRRQHEGRKCGRAGGRASERAGGRASARTANVC
jgi:hypothetical protein